MRPVCQRRPEYAVNLRLPADAVVPIPSDVVRIPVGCIDCDRHNHHIGLVGFEGHKGDRYCTADDHHTVDFFDHTADHHLVAHHLVAHIDYFRMDFGYQNSRTDFVDCTHFDRYTDSLGRHTNYFDYNSHCNFHCSFHHSEMTTDQIRI